MGEVLTMIHRLVVRAPVSGSGKIDFTDAFLSSAEDEQAAVKEAAKACRMGACGTYIALPVSAYKIAPERGYTADEHVMWATGYRHLIPDIPVADPVLVDA